jgi:four helix bundle protein
LEIRQNLSFKTSKLKTVRDGPIVVKSVDFSISIITLCDLLNSKKRFIIASQLLKSGTSIGANVFEAQHSESRLDFIHKMKIALKEANETLYWLTLCEKMEGLKVNQEIRKGLDEIMAILSKIIITSKKNLKQGQMTGDQVPVIKDK